MENAKYDSFFYHSTGENKALKIKLDHEDGGMNYLSGQANRRGIYLYFTMVETQDRGTYKMESYSPFSEGNFKVFLKELKRRNKNTEQKFAEILQNNKENLILYHDTKDVGSIAKLFS